MADSVSTTRAEATQLDSLLQLIGDSKTASVPQDIPVALLRSVIAAGPNGGIQLGKTIINISSSSDIHIGLSSADRSTLQLIQDAISSATQSIEINRFQRTLRDYFGAMREFSDSFGYDLRYVFTDDSWTSLSLNSAYALSTVYVPLQYVSLTPQDASAEVPAKASIDLRDAIRSSSNSTSAIRVLFEGPPGSGKSTIMRQVVRYCWDDPEQLSLPCRLIPIYVRLATLAQSIGASVEERLWSSIAADNLISLGSPPPVGWYTEWPQIMGTSFIFLLDGFDEVGPEKQIELRGWIDRLLRTGHSVMITSRAISSVGLALADRFHCYRLASFNCEQQAQLANNWLGDRATPFLQELRKTQTSIVASTPLLLTVAAYVYASTNKLPKGRAELYNWFLTAWLGESRRRGISQDLGPQSDYLREALAFLALEMTSAPTETTEQYLRARLASFYEQALKRPAIEASHWAQVFISISTKRSAIFTSSHGLCSWIHPTFREYLAAEAITTLPHSQQQLFSYADRWSEEPWQEVVLFLVAIESQRGNATNLVRHIARHNSLEALLFVGAILAEGTVVDPAVMNGALESLSELVLEEIIQREKDDRAHGATNLRLASQTALRLLSNFGANIVESKHLTMLGTHVAQLAAKQSALGETAVQTLTEIRCFDQLAQLVGDGQVSLSARLQAALSLIEADRFDSILSSLPALLSKDVGSRSAQLLAFLDDKLTSAQILTLLTRGLLYSVAQSFLLQILIKRGDASIIESIAANKSLSAILRMEAYILLNGEQGTDRRAFDRFLGSIISKRKSPELYPALLNWLTQHGHWTCVSVLALSKACPEPVAAEAIRELAAAAPDAAFEVFVALQSSFLKMEAAVALWPTNINAQRKRAIEEWCSSDQVAKNAAVLFRWADSLHNAGEYLKEINVYSSIIAQEPANNLALANRGGCYRLLDRFDEAIEDFNAALQTDPADAWTLVRRGHCLWALDREAQAIEDFRLAESHGFTETYFYLHYGDCCRILGDLANAVKYLNKRIASGPNDSRPYYFRGLIFSDGGYPDRAAADYTAAVEIEETFVLGHRALADTFTLRGMFQEARLCLERALTATQQNTSINYRYVKTLLCLGDVEPAQRIADSILESAPGEHPYQYLVLLTKFARDRDGQAFEAELSKVISAAEAALRDVNISAKAYASQMVNLAIYHAALIHRTQASEFTTALLSLDKLDTGSKRIMFVALTELAHLRPDSDCCAMLLKQLDFERTVTALEDEAQPFPDRGVDASPEPVEQHHYVLKIPKSSEPYPFPCYCRASQIVGLAELQLYGSEMLKHVDASVSAIALITLDDSEKVFGYCNFKQEVGDNYNLKFCDTYRTFVDRNVKLFVEGIGVSCILCAEPALLDCLQSDGVDVRYGLSLRLATVSVLS
jgi:tetratricopeptide (TPR) repeat protein